MIFRDFLQKNRPTIIYLLSLTISIIFLVTQSLTNYLLTFRSFLIYFFSSAYVPVYKVVDYPVKVFNKLLSLSYLYEENLMLKKTVEKFYMYKINYDTIVDRINSLDNTTYLSQILQYSVVNSEVIMRSYDSWYDECIVNILESPDKVKEDAPVIMYVKPNKFYAVGRIWMINSNIAKVLLITNTLSMIPAKIRGKEIYGMIVGNSSAVLTMDYILLEDDVRVGDIVETSGINNFPSGIEIGKVVDIEISSTGFKKAVVKTNFNINSIKQLLIVVAKK